MAWQLIETAPTDGTKTENITSRINASLKGVLTKSIAAALHWWDEYGDTGPDPKHVPTRDQIVDAAGERYRNDPLFHRRVKNLVQVVVSDIETVKWAESVCGQQYRPSEQTGHQGD